MASIETISSPPSVEGKRWQQKRIEIQIEIMGRMGVPTRAHEAADMAERRKINEKVTRWGEKYAKRFSDITGDNLGLQTQLMSDDIQVRESAVEMVIDELQKTDE